MKIKPIWVALTTLIMGVMLGMLITGHITKKRLHSFTKFRTEEGFRHRFLEIINPDEEQMKQLRPIIEKYGERHHEITDSVHDRVRELMKAFHDEMEPLLTEEQKERLKHHHLQRMHRMKKRPKRHREHRFPHHE